MEAKLEKINNLKIIFGKNKFRNYIKINPKKLIFFSILFSKIDLFFRFLTPAITRCPALAHSIAVSRPIPLEHPVIRITLQSLT